MASPRDKSWKRKFGVWKDALGALGLVVIFALVLVNFEEIKVPVFSFFQDRSKNDGKVLIGIGSVLLGILSYLHYLVTRYSSLIYLGREEFLRREEKADAAEKNKKAYQEYLSLLPDEQLEQLIRQKVKEKSKAENKEEIKVWRNLYSFSDYVIALGSLILLSLFIGAVWCYFQGIVFLCLFLLLIGVVFRVAYGMRQAIFRIFYQPEVLIQKVINKEIRRIKRKKFDQTLLNWEPPECHETSMIIVKN